VGIHSVGSVWAWAGFTALVLGLLALDLFVFNRREHEVRVREALGWSAFWIALAFAFNGWIWWEYGGRPALEFLTGYLLEKALSVDNLFVFLVVFSYFKVPAAYQHRVLFWGILGALVMRALFIWLGAVLLAQFTWVTYVFGALLVITGAKLLFAGDVEVEPDRNIVLRLFRRVVPATTQFHGSHFWVVEGGRRLATPLLLVLVVVETTDVVFAVDSIPAIFGITTDPFIVYTSNIFAILGLRALYFALSASMQRFQYLQVGLALVLGFVGVKMLISWHPPIGLSLGVVAGILTTAVVGSILRPGTRKLAGSEPNGEAQPTPEGVAAPVESSGGR
jgi:tellurite resistance protein TerC